MPHVSSAADDAFYCCPDFLCKDNVAGTPNAAAAAGVMFCQMQQLCSFTSMSWLQSLQLLWSASPLPSLLKSVNLRKWWTIFLLCLFCHFCPSLVRVLHCLTLKHSHTPFLICSAKTVELIRCFLYISLLLQTIDLKLTQLLIVWDILFSISGAHSFLWPARNILLFTGWSKTQNKLM